MSSPVIRLKEISFMYPNLIAWGKGTIPQTMQTKEFPTLTLWLTHVSEPIMITYDSVAERDKEFDVVESVVGFIETK